jgi:hypothetical protein
MGEAAQPWRRQFVATSLIAQKNGPGGSSNHARAASDPEFADCETV